MESVLPRPRIMPPPVNQSRPIKLRTAFESIRTALNFVRRLLTVFVALPFVVLPALLPVSSLLLMLPAVMPNETVITDTASRASGLTGILRRIFAIAVGLASVVALLVAAYEVVIWLNLTGVKRWIAWFVIVYLLDTGMLAAIGKVPLRYNIRNLMVRWRITLLTSVAFTVVVALLTVMLAFVTGMYRITEDSGQPANIMILGDGSTDEVFSTLGYGDVDLIETERCTLDENDQLLPQPIFWKTKAVGERTQFWGSKETLAIACQPLIEKPGYKRFVQVRGIVEPELSGRVHDLTISVGRWFSQAGVQTPPGAEPGERDQIEAVLGAGVARELASSTGKSALVPGDSFELADRSWVVVGVMNSDGTAFGSEVWAKQTLVAKLFNKTSYNSLVARVDAQGTREEQARTAEIMAYHLRNRFTNPKVNAQTEIEYYSKQSENNRTFLFAIILIAVIMALGGIFGVMNTMFAAIDQRTRDIGMLRIIGFKRWQILVSFLLESLAIAVVGGVLGCALGSLFDGLSATSSISSGQSNKTVVLRLAVDSTVLLTGVLFTLVMGRLGGLIPALSAMRLKILESLR